MKRAKKKVEFSLDTVQRNPETRLALEGFVEEIVSYKREVAKISVELNDCRTQAAETLGIPDKVLMRLVKEKLDPGVLEAEVLELEEAQLISQVIEHDGKAAPAP